MAEREAAARLERAEHEARRLADEITTEATQRAELIRESEQSTYLRLLAARDDLQQAIDRLVTNLGVGARMADERAMADEGQSVVDLTTAPAQVRHETVPAGAGLTNGDAAAALAIAPVGATPRSAPPPATRCCAWSGPRWGAPLRARPATAPTSRPPPPELSAPGAPSV